MNVQRIDLQLLPDADGHLSVEQRRDIPFDIDRVMLVYGVPEGATKNGHAYAHTHQLLIAVNGQLEVTLDDGQKRSTVTLDKPHQGLHLPPGIWSQQTAFSPGAVCLVLLSAPNEEDDLISDYNAFLISKNVLHEMESAVGQTESPSNQSGAPSSPELPFYDLQRLTQTHGSEIKAAVNRVIDKGWYVLGHEVETFERHYAAYIGTKHCIGVGNGLDALRLILRAYIELGRLQEGDEILVPANTFIASMLAITDNRLQPVLVEPDARTLQIDGTKLEAALTPRTKAVMIVHLYGQNAWTETIAAFCTQHGLLLLEDNAQAAGCNVQVPTLNTTQKTGSLGHAAGHSFYPTKPLGALGDGGAVTTNDDQLATTVRQLANYGSGRKYVFLYQGYNSRLDELQAAALDVKLRYLDSENERRRHIARLYKQGLNHPTIQLPDLSLNNDNVYHLYPILVGQAQPSVGGQANAPTDGPSAGTVRNESRRDALQQYLAAQGIQTQIHYPIPPHRQACYKTWTTASYPITEAIHQRELSLPLSPVMTDNDVQRVIDAINHWNPDACT